MGEQKFTEQKTGSNHFAIRLISFVIIISLVFGGLFWIYQTFILPAFIESIASSPTTSQSYSATRVDYVIEGSAESVDVTLTNQYGGIEQHEGVPLPKQYTYEDFSERYMSISAQNNDEFGVITVKIYINGKQTKYAMSSGAFAIASVSDYK